MATPRAAVGVATTRTRTDVAGASSSVVSVLASSATNTLGFTSKQSPVLVYLAVETETGLLPGKDGRSIRTGCPLEMCPPSR